MTGSSSSPVAIIGVGACTAVGRTAPASAAAIRARLPMLAEHPYYVDRFGNPVVVGRASWLPAEMDFLPRLCALAAEAAREALTPLSEIRSHRPARLAILIGLPTQAEPESRIEMVNQVTGVLTALIPKGFATAARGGISQGGAAGLTALEEAGRLIEEDRVDVCLVGGVDSHLDVHRIDWLDWTGQLHSANNSWGYIPGEAAGFCVLASEKFVQASSAKPLGHLLGATTTKETKLWRDRAVCIGEGLTESMRQTLAALPEEDKIDEVICDLNGEPHRADEYGFAMTRLGDRFSDPGAFRTPADCWGDVGAASGPLFVDMAVLAGQKGYAHGSHALVWASSRGAERASALIHVDVSSGKE